jgi:hypothetical protein
MKQIALFLVLLGQPAFAEDAPVPPAADGGGFSLMEEGAKLVLRGLMTEMEPALDEMEQALNEIEPSMKELAPKFRELVALIDDFKNYSAPEILPNGDIIMRRTAPLPPKTGPALPGPNGEVEL